MNIYISRMKLRNEIICKLQMKYFRITEKVSSNETMDNYQTNL